MAGSAEDREPKHFVVIYDLSLAIRRVVDDGDDPAEYVTQKAKTALEREVLKCLRRLDGDCDCEVITYTAREENR